MTAPRENHIADVGLSLVHDAEDAAIVDIVFIHGLTGHPRRTWEAQRAVDPQTNVFWPGDLLPQELPASRIFSFGYASEFISLIASHSKIAHTGIEDVALSLLTSVAAKRAATTTEARPLIFICHSLGGLICAHALSSPLSSTRPQFLTLVTHTVGALFFGTPFRGSKVAKYVDVLERVVHAVSETSSQFLRDLKTSSARLDMIRKNFHVMLNTRARERRQLEVGFFFESLATRLGGTAFGRRRVVVVDQESATLEGYVAIPLMSDHRNLCRFAVRDSADYQCVIGTIQDIVENIDNGAEPVEASSECTTMVTITAGAFTANGNYLNNGVMTGHNISTKENGVTNTVTNTYAPSDVQAQHAMFRTWSEGAGRRPI